MGAMGVLAIFFILAIKWSGLAALDSHRALVLLAVPAYARSSQLVGIIRLPYGRPEGVGREFFRSPLKRYDFWGVLLPVGLSFFMGWRGICLILTFLLVSFGIVLFYKKRLNCITGDMVGALSEICEAALFLVAAAGGTF
jgi:adenosylcobinamide-GDP ribazoletransferase